MTNSPFTDDEKAFLRALLDDEQERIRQLFEHQINIYAQPEALANFYLTVSILEKLGVPDNSFDGKE